MRRWQWSLGRWLRLAAVVSAPTWLLGCGDSPVPIAEQAKSAVAGNEGLALSRKVISEEDLPPAGTRSLFDHVIAQNDGLPYPISKLVKVLQDQNPTAEPPITLLIPVGRSLLKGQADNLHPRLAIAADFEGKNTPAGLGKAPRGQLFVAMVENAKELEVLSYNEAAGRFEYQLVQNYCEGCVPRIVYARRQICLTCHQGGTPIFSQRPWSETNGQPETARAIAVARGSSEPYHGVALQQPLASAERFDQLTDVGNFYLVTQRLWLDGCGAESAGGNECRRRMLSLALQYADNVGSFKPEGKEVERLRELQAKTFPKAGIVVPESDLLNRDPIGEKQGVKGWLRSLITREIKLGEGAKDNEDLEAFDKLPPLRRELDPLTVRAPKRTLTANDIDGAYGLASFFTEADLKTLKMAHGNDMKKLLARVEALPDKAFGEAPFVRVRMMEALLGQPREYCCLKTDEMSPPVVSGVPPLAINALPELKPFEQYCFSCHRGNPAKRLNFMAGDTEAEVLANIKGKAEIRDSLDWERYENTDKSSKLMPPRDSVQYHRWQQAGAGAVDERNKMRELVPGMFQF